MTARRWGMEEHAAGARQAGPGLKPAARTPGDGRTLELPDRELLPARILALQRLAGNASVQALLWSWNAMAVPAVQRKEEGPLFTLVKGSSKPVNRHQVIREILDGLTWGWWTFPKQESGDGCMGTNTISASLIPGATARRDHRRRPGREVKRYIGLTSWK